MTFLHEVQGLESASASLNHMFHHLELSITKSEALFMTSWTHLLQQMSNDLTHFFSHMHHHHQQQKHSITTTATPNKDRTDDSQTQAKCYQLLSHWYENLWSQKQRYQTMIDNERTRRKQQWKQESNDFMKRILNQIEKHSEMITPYSKSILKPSKTDDHQRVIYFDRNNGKNHNRTPVIPRTVAVVQTTKQDVELRALQRLLEYFEHQLQTCIINREQGEKMNKIQKDVKRIKVAIEELEKDIQKERKTDRPPQQHRELKQSLSERENSLYQTNDILLKPSKFDDCNDTIASQMHTRANPKYPQLVLPSTVVPDEEDTNDTCIHSEDTGKRGRGPKSMSSTPSPSHSSTFLIGRKLNFDDEEVKKVSPSVPTPSNGCIVSHIPFSKNMSQSSIEAVDECCGGGFDTLKNQNLNHHLNSDGVSSLTMTPIQNLSLEDKNFSTLDMEMFEADIDKSSPSHLRQTCHSQESSPLTTRDMLPLIQTTPPPTETQFIMEQASKTSPPDRPHGLILKETRKIENIHYCRPDKHLTPNHCDLRNSWSLRVENQAGVVTHNKKFDLKQDRATSTLDISKLSPILKNGTTNNGLHPQGANRTHHRPRNVTLSPNFATSERENSFDDEHEWLSNLKGIE